MHGHIQITAMICEAVTDCSNFHVDTRTNVNIEDKDQDIHITLILPYWTWIYLSCGDQDCVMDAMCEHYHMYKNN